MISEIFILPRPELCEGQIIVYTQPRGEHILSLVTALSPLHPQYGETGPDILNPVELKEFQDSCPNRLPGFNWTKTCHIMVFVVRNNQNYFVPIPPTVFKLIVEDLVNAFERENARAIRAVKATADQLAQLKSL